ncbi:hypothetical protein ACQP2X_42350 [Actinoplanes sp. CA-131856]
MASWQRLDDVAAVRVAGLRARLIAEVLDPLEIRFVALADEARVACLRLTMITKPVREPGAPLLPGTTLDVFTVAGFRGIGVARLLWPWAALVCTAHRRGLRPLHSPSRTRAGQAYAEAVGGEIPALAGGRYVDCPERFDAVDALWRGRQHLDLEASRSCDKRVL